MSSVEMVTCGKSVRLEFLRLSSVRCDGAITDSIRSGS